MNENTVIASKYPAVFMNRGAEGAVEKAQELNKNGKMSDTDYRKVLKAIENSYI